MNMLCWIGALLFQYVTQTTSVNVRDVIRQFLIHSTFIKLLMKLRISKYIIEVKY